MNTSSLLPIQWKQMANERGFCYSTSAPPQQGGDLYSLLLPTATFSHLLLLYVGLCIFFLLSFIGNI